MQMLISQHKVLAADDWSGLLIAVTIIGLWFVSLFALLTIPILNTSWFWLMSAVLVRTYFHTGLFILAHDAIHVNLVPHNRGLNHLIGRVAVTIYGFLSYDLCFKNHFKHHRYPSQSEDPDFHGSAASPLLWYCKFIYEYFPRRSLIIFLVNMILMAGVLTTIFHVPLTNLIFFGLLPLVLSSLQLFFFGTYLPHQQVYGNPNFSPRLQSSYSSNLWSFFSCYNFGHYHWEHHQYPEIPWYRLHQTHKN